MDPVTQDQLLTKVGGNFKMVVLIQKRMRELVRGLPALVPHEDATNLWDIVAREILEGKVDLITGEAAEKVRKEIAAKEAEEAPAAAAAAHAPVPVAAGDKKD